MKLSVVIPAHNESANIGSTVRQLERRLIAEAIDHELLIVNDHSSDDTEDLLRRLCVDSESIRYLNNPYMPGFGLAVRWGLENFTGDAVAVYMADASDRPEDLVAFFRVMMSEGVDCVFGSRFIEGGRVIDYPVPKLVLNRLANHWIRLLFNLRYDDITNAFKLYHRRVIEGVKPILSHHFNLTVELPLKAIIRGFSYSIVPNHWINRSTGESKFKIKEMGSRYLFIVLYCFIEKWLSRGDYHSMRVLSADFDSSLRTAVRAIALTSLVAITFVNVWQLTLIRNPLIETPGDEAVAYDRHIQQLRPLLPSSGRVGFLTDTPPLDARANADSVMKYYLTQYALAPLVVRPGTEDEFVIGYFADPKAAAIQTTGLTIVKDFGDGLMLLRRKSN